MPKPAPACTQALADANAHWPKRKKASDGIMGDARHQATKSDHNLGNAVDITNDPDSGCTGHVIAAAALEDPRVKYVIWNRQINEIDGKGWQKYKHNDVNPHTKHCHISIHAVSRDDTTHWRWGTTSYFGPKDQAPASEKDADTLPLLPRFPGDIAHGASGPDVTTIQNLLKLQGWTIDVNGYFDLETKGVVKLFQLRHDLPSSGVVDLWTWKAIWRYAGIYPTLAV